MAKKAKRIQVTQAPDRKAGRPSIVNKLLEVVQDLRQEIGSLVHVTAKIDAIDVSSDRDDHLMAEYIGDTVLLHMLSERYMTDVPSTDAEKGIRLRKTVIRSIKRYKDLRPYKVQVPDPTVPPKTFSMRERLWDDLNDSLQARDI